MRINQRVTRMLMNRLPPDEQARLVGDLIAWRFADLPPAEQQEKIEQLGPGLMEMMRKGRVGLLLLITTHLLRLLSLRWPSCPPRHAGTRSGGPLDPKCSRKPRRGMAPAEISTRSPAGQGVSAGHGDKL
jgi:hypothetical protein